MNESPIKTIRLVNGKTIQPQDLPPEAWRVVFGDQDHGNLSRYYQSVSWVYRGVDIRQNAIKRIPFIIENSAGTEIDNSDSYQNAVEFFPKPKAVFAITEMALTIWNYSYLLRRDNILGSRTFDVRYLIPTSITPLWKKDGEGNVTGLAGFERNVGSRKKALGIEDIIYFWKEDPFVEYGHPDSSPLMAAAASAGVLLNVDNFAASYFERGAVKATLLAVSGNPPQAERERVKSFWQRFMTGLRNAWGDSVISADGITPIVVGEGLEALSDNNLNQERREAIATAIGIPHSMLFSGAANFAVSQQDELNLYSTTVVPEAEFIEETLNEQLFVPAGYRLRFMPDSMDLYQEDEEQRAASMSAFMDAMQKAGTYEMAQALFQIYGVEVPAEAMKFIEQHFAKKDEQRQQMAERLPAGGQFGQNGQSAQNEPPRQARPQQAPQPDNTRSVVDERTDLDRWKTKSLKAVKSGKSADVPFETDEIPMAMQGAISGALAEAATEADVAQVFDDLTWVGYP